MGLWAVGLGVWARSARWGKVTFLRFLSQDWVAESAHCGRYHLKHLGDSVNGSRDRKAQMMMRGVS